jgi:hypothetical protein
VYNLTAGRVNQNFYKMKKSMISAFAVGLCITVNLWAQAPNYVPTNGLVGWWPFNGNANDESGNGNNGTVNGATLTTDRFGNVGKSFDFNGTSNITFPIATQFSPANSTGYTISCWYRLNENNTGFFMQLADNNFNTSNYDFYSSSNQNKGRIAVGHFPQVISTWAPDSINNYTWVNILAVYNQLTDSINLFKNGNFWFAGLIGNQPPGQSTLSIGGVVTNLQNVIGQLDDIGIWNRALTQQEITDLYNANVCYEYVTVTDTLVINTGITGYNPITYMNTLKIWPNPTNDHITIDAGDLTTMNGYSIKIEDAQGQQVFQNAVNQQQFYIDITTWGGNGLYFVRIIDPQGNTVDIKKIVLQ